MSTSLITVCPECKFSMVGGARIVVFASMWIGAVCLSTRLWLLTFAFVVLPFRDR